MVKKLVVQVKTGGQTKMRPSNYIKMEWCTRIVGTPVHRPFI